MFHSGRRLIAYLYAELETALQGYPHPRLPVRIAGRVKGGAQSARGLLARHHGLRTVTT